MIDTTTIITKISKSRKILLELLEKRGFNIDNYTNFNASEINLMYINNQLDLLLEDDYGKKVKIMYSLGKILRPNTIMDFAEELYNIENVLKVSDELIIVQQSEPNDSLIHCLNGQYNEKGYYINIFNLDRLQYNILNHTLVPQHKILDEEELNIIKNKFNITNNNQLPDISRYDPVAMVIGLRPGQICEISRNSVTALNSKYYRFCS